MADAKVDGRNEGTSSAELPVVTYEERLSRNFSWALGEGSMHFEGKSAVQQALRKIAECLNSLQIDYAVAGGMALFAHGLRRFTEDVDILVTREGLKAIHEGLEGRGYLPPFRGSKNLRDTENGVRIEFLVAGEYPGDGKRKPVVFPDPKAVALERDGIKFLNLPTLMELKLASGMTNSDRIKDLADVQELIKLFQLPYDFADNLNPYVRDKYYALWQGTTNRYVSIRQMALRSPDIQSMTDVLENAPKSEVETLSAMEQEGVKFDQEHSRPADGYLVFVTEDSQIAGKYDMHPESEILYEDE